MSLISHFSLAADYLQSLPKPCFVIMVGLPLSGKDSLLRQLDTQTFQLLSRDAIMMELYGGSNYKEAFENQDAKKVDALFWQQLRQAVDKQENIVVNTTNLTTKRRRTLLDAVSAHYFICGIVLPIPTQEEWVKRNENRAVNENKSLPLSLYADCVEKYEQPLFFEGFNQLLFIHPEKQNTTR
jgi:predicted kinase